MFPTLFISHGAPNFILGDSSSKEKIVKFSKTLKKPKYIIIFSAHYITDELRIINHKAKGLMYDFYGFEKELYNFNYEIKNDQNISEKLMEYLKTNNFEIKEDINRKTYDHGVWTSLSMIYEKLDIPVIQFSLPMNYSEQKLISLGKVLQKFKDEAMLISSGGITHNLKDMDTSLEIKKYAKDFNNYIKEVIIKGEEKELIMSTKKDEFYLNHPTKEHFLPLFIAFGNALNKKGSSFNSEIVYSNISMESFYFDKD